MLGSLVSINADAMELINKFSGIRCSSCTHRREDVFMEERKQKKAEMPEKITQRFWEEHPVNLSDFALFLSVMKNRKAYRNTLSIIMDEPDIELAEVKVEQVILNQSGKRAIRLDAWAQDTKQRQFNMEMQNDASHDDIPRRSRFYQGMLDTPILKSGRETRYRELPSTVIIFITQEDIFGENLAEYTFVERCEEVERLYLNNGTKKVFLNMASKNGRPELVSLLQYMKDTRIDNPEIRIRDERIVELDDIVREVKSSEEWEEVRMNLIELGEARGEAIGEARGEAKGRADFIGLIRKKKQRGLNAADIAELFETDEAYVDEIMTLLEEYPEADNLEIAGYLLQIRRMVN